MFQLIVAVIAIALVIALTLASIFYGGEAFTRSSLKANVAALVNQAQQISGAHTLYKTDKAKKAADVQSLTTDKYLAAVPNAPKIVNTGAVWEFDATKTYVQIALPVADVAEIAEAVANNGAGKVDQSGAQPLFQFPL
jgi:hypothetical protein